MRKIFLLMLFYSCANAQKSDLYKAMQQELKTKVNPFWDKSNFEKAFEENKRTMKYNCFILNINPIDSTIYDISFHSTSKNSYKMEDPYSRYLRLLRDCYKYESKIDKETIKLNMLNQVELLKVIKLRNDIVYSLIMERDANNLRSHFENLSKVKNQNESDKITNQIIKILPEYAILSQKSIDIKDLKNKLNAHDVFLNFFHINKEQWVLEITQQGIELLTINEYLRTIEEHGSNKYDLVYYSPDIYSSPGSDTFKKIQIHYTNIVIVPSAKIFCYMVEYRNKKINFDSYIGFAYDKRDNFKQEIDSVSSFFVDKKVELCASREIIYNNIEKIKKADIIHFSAHHANDRLKFKQNTHISEKDVFSMRNKSSCIINLNCNTLLKKDIDNSHIVYEWDILSNLTTSFYASGTMYILTSNKEISYQDACLFSVCFVKNLFKYKTTEYQDKKCIQNAFFSSINEISKKTESDIYKNIFLVGF